MIALVLAVGDIVHDIVTASEALIPQAAGPTNFVSIVLKQAAELQQADFVNKTGYHSGIPGPVSDCAMWKTA